MNAAKNETRRAAEALAFHSFKGHDVNDGRPRHANNHSRRDAQRVSTVKRKGARAARRASRATAVACAAE